MFKYVCIDLGASGGKMSLGEITNEKINLKEIYRFKNSAVKISGSLCWDFKMIFNEILVGLQKVKKMGINKCYLGIDTWGVDYALIDNDGNLIDKIYSYRDKRTQNILKNNSNILNAEELYKKTGIVPHEFNTLYQLYADQIWNKQNLNKILLLPDYLIYLLTGKFVAEVTNLSTTQLFDSNIMKFDKSILDILKIDESKFGEIVKPGDLIGKIKSDLILKFNIPQCEIIAVASHDTASAIAAIPTVQNESLFISSGTWSLLGIEKNSSLISSNSYRNKFTNGIGVNNKIIFLKNIIGLWITQEIEKNLSNKFTIVDLIREAHKFESYEYLMNCEDTRYISPDNMIYEIWKYFDEAGQKLPFNIGQLIRCVFDSLALSYFDNIQNIEKITETKTKDIYIFGGGCQNNLINQELANLTKKTVYAGPIDATMIGNIVIQMIAKNEIKNLESARKIIANSFEINKFLPDDVDYQSVINKYNLVKEMRKNNERNN